MDRYAIFVDVGYVVASVAELLAGSAERHLVGCDYGQLVRSLVLAATDDERVADTHRERDGVAWCWPRQMAYAA